VAVDGPGDEGGVNDGALLGSATEGMFPLIACSASISHSSLFTCTLVLSMHPHEFVLFKFLSDPVRLEVWKRDAMQSITSREGVFGGEVMRRYRQLGFGGDPQVLDLAVLLNGDGFQPYGMDSRSVHSTFAIYVKFLNGQRGLIVPVMLIPPASSDTSSAHEARRTNFNKCIKFIFKELGKLFTDGIRAPTGTSATRVRVWLVGVACDYPAMVKFSGRPQAPSANACHVCVHTGQWNAGARTTTYPIGNATTSQMMAKPLLCHRDFMGCCAFLKYLPYVDASRLFCLDAMHLVFAGLVKRTTKLIVGDGHKRRSTLLPSGSATADSFAGTASGSASVCTVLPCSPAQRKQINAKMRIIRCCIPTRYYNQAAADLEHKMTAANWRVFIFTQARLALWEQCDPRAYVVLCKLSTLLLKLFSAAYVFSMSSVSRDGADVAGTAANLAQSEYEGADDMGLVLSLQKECLQLMRLYEDTFGAGTITINAHHFIHLPRMLQLFGKLQEVWCFSFERENKQLTQHSSWSTRSPELRMLDYIQASLALRLLNTTHVQPIASSEEDWPDSVASASNPGRDAVSESEQADGRGGELTTDMFQLTGMQRVEINHAQCSPEEQALLDGIRVFLVNNNLEGQVPVARPGESTVLLRKCQRVIRLRDKLLICTPSYARCRQSRNYVVSTLGQDDGDEQQVWMGSVKSFWLLNDNLALVELEHWYVAVSVAHTHRK